MYDETRGPRMGRGGGDVLVVPVITAMLSAREDCWIHVKLRAATVIAEEQRVRGRRWTAIADRRIILVLARLAIDYVASRSSSRVESTSSHHGHHGRRELAS